MTGGLIAERNRYGLWLEDKKKSWGPRAQIDHRAVPILVVACAQSSLVFCSSASKMNFMLSTFKD